LGPFKPTQKGKSYTSILTYEEHQLVGMAMVEMPQKFLGFSVDGMMRMR
jgi:hypothetical protein